MAPIKSRRALRAACAPLLLLTAAAHAQVPSTELPTEPPPVPAPDNAKTEVEVGTMPQWLTNGRGTWQEYYVDLLHRYGKNDVVYGTLRETRRFGQNDTQAVVGTYTALSPRVIAVLEASGSPTHNVLPTWSASGQLGYLFDGGWGVYAGMRHTDFPGAQVNTALFLIERYFGNFRAAYALNESWLSGSGAAPMHAVTLNYYYGNRNQLTLAVANGREVENVGPPQGVISSNVTSASFNGRHWVTRDFAVSYEVFYQNQAAFYAQTGVRLGLRYGF